MGFLRDYPRPLPGRQRSRTPGGRRRGAGAAVGRPGKGRRRPPPRGPHPFMGPGYKVGGSVPEVNESLKAKGYQVGGALAPLSRPPNQPGPLAPGIGARGLSRPPFVGGIAGGPPKGRPTLGPQPRRRRGRGRGGRDV